MSAGVNTDIRRPDHGAFHRGPGRGRAGVLRGGGHRDRPRAQLQRRRPAGHPARGHRQRSDGPALLDGRRRRRPARPPARPRSPLARRRRGERREREATRRVSPRHGLSLSLVLATVHAVAGGRGEDVRRPRADSARPPGRRPRARSRPAGPRGRPPHRRPRNRPRADVDRVRLLVSHDNLRGRQFETHAGLGCRRVPARETVGIVGIRRWQSPACTSKPRLSAT